MDRRLLSLSREKNKALDETYPERTIFMFSPNSQRYLKLARKAWRYDPVTKPNGWPHELYFDRESNEFLIANFPRKGCAFEMSHMPELGDAEVTTGGVTYEINFRD
jgi:hypothetical protein